jgi:hypothetical protein
MNNDISYEVGNIQDIYEISNSMEKYETEKEENGNCKYCGTTDENKFKSRAHLIPEFTGNKDWFCYDECDDCNNLFSAYEYSLKSFGGFKNSHLPIKGKKKFPKYVDGYHGFTLQFQEENKLVLKTNKKNDFFKIENDKIQIKSMTMPFVPLNVYKCLAKIGLSLMNKKDFEKFDSGLKWLMDKKDKTEPNTPPIMLFNPNSKPVIKPIAILLKKKIDYNSPEFTLIFIWGFYIFQMFLPFNKSDNKLNYADLKLPIMFEFITKSKEDKFGVAHYYMNSLERIQSLERINFGFKEEKQER